MKIRLLLVAAALLTMTIAYAQDATRTGEIELTRQAIQMKRQEIVNNAIDFTDQESAAFWPLYRDWRAKMAGIGDRKLELIAQFEKSYGAVSDEQAKSMLDEWLKIEADTLKLKRDYAKQFRKILPEKKVTRFFHLENKLDAALNYDLAGSVPLVD